MGLTNGPTLATFDGIIALVGSLLRRTCIPAPLGPHPPSPGRTRSRSIWPLRTGLNEGSDVLRVEGINAVAWDVIPAVSEGLLVAGNPTSEWGA